MYAEFDLAVPESLEAALAALGEGPTPTVPLAGGTNLIVDIRARREWPARVVALERLTELRGIREEEGRIVLGARTTVSDILHAPLIRRESPALVEAARLFAGQMVRNVATVGGNIACGSPAADLVPPLMVLDAEVELTGPAERRRVPLADYFTGYKESVRRADELITAVSWARPPRGAAQRFYKLARRVGDAITITGVAVLVAAGEGRCTRARIALGAVAPTVIRVAEAEALLEGRALDSALIDEAARAAVAAARPIDDIRASAEYRRHTVEVLTRRLLREAWAEATRGG